MRNIALPPRTRETRRRSCSRSTRSCRQSNSEVNNQARNVCAPPIAYVQNLRARDGWLEFLFLDPKLRINRLRRVSRNSSTRGGLTKAARIRLHLPLRLDYDIWRAMCEGSARSGLQPRREVHGKEAAVIITRLKPYYRTARTRLTRGRTSSIWPSGRRAEDALSDQRIGCGSGLRNGSTASAISLAW